MRIRSRPEKPWLNRVNSGSVSRMIHVSDKSSRMRMPIAAPRPSVRPRCCCSFGSFPTRIEMKMTLSTPRTTSRNVSVSSAISPSAVKKASMGSTRYQMRAPSRERVYNQFT